MPLTSARGRRVRGASRKVCAGAVAACETSEEAILDGALNKKETGDDWATSPRCMSAQQRQDGSVAPGSGSGANNALPAVAPSATASTASIRTAASKPSRRTATKRGDDEAGFLVGGWLQSLPKSPVKSSSSASLQRRKPWTTQPEGLVLPEGASQMARELTRPLAEDFFEWPRPPPKDHEISSASAGLAEAIARRYVGQPERLREKQRTLRQNHDVLVRRRQLETIQQLQLQDMEASTDVQSSASSADASTRTLTLEMCLGCVHPSEVVHTTSHVRIDIDVGVQVVVVKPGKCKGALALVVPWNEEAGTSDTPAQDTVKVKMLTGMAVGSYKEYTVDELVEAATTRSSESFLRTQSLSRKNTREKEQPTVARTASKSGSRNIEQPTVARTASKSGTRNISRTPSKNVRQNTQKMSKPESETPSLDGRYSPECEYGSEEQDHADFYRRSAYGNTPRRASADGDTDSVLSKDEISPRRSERSPGNSLRAITRKFTSRKSTVHALPVEPEPVPDGKLQAHDLLALARKHQIAIDDVRSRYKDFQDIDLDGNCVLDVQEFTEAVRRRLEVATVEEIPQHMLATQWGGADKNNSGTVDFEEYLIWATNTAFSEESFVTDEKERSLRQFAREQELCFADVLEVRKVFDRFDKDCSEAIDADEFRQVVMVLWGVTNESDVPAARFQRHWRDATRDGKAESLEFQEFFVWYQNNC